ncbi:histidine kinase [candidate division KSB1 bacterium]|nr:histidine kinase [candidate division KSB1 bacterium]
MTISRTWIRPLLLGWLVWTIYSAFHAGVLSLSERLPYVYALPSSLMSNYLMALYTIPVWFWTTYVLAPRHWLVQVLGHVAGAFAFAFGWVESFWQLFIWLYGREIFELARMERTRYWQALSTMSMYGLVVGVFYMRRHHRQLREKERREADLRLHTNKMELAVLKAQLNPHFLFNTLNSINAMVGSDPEGARQVLARLAEVLRYSLESDRRALVPLAEELRFVATYLDIEQARFGKRLQVRLEIDNEARALLVPPMILQPLAENAVRHGIAPKEEGGELIIRVQTRNAQLDIEVADNGVGTTTSRQEELLHNGTGLRNTDLRLRKMFGEDAGLQVSTGEAGFRVKFHIPITEAQLHTDHPT